MRGVFSLIAVDLKAASCPFKSLSFMHSLADINSWSTMKCEVVGGSCLMALSMWSADAWTFWSFSLISNLFIDRKPNTAIVSRRTARSVNTLQTNGGIVLGNLFDPIYLENLNVRGSEYYRVHPAVLRSLESSRWDSVEYPFSKQYCYFDVFYRCHFRPGHNDIMRNAVTAIFVCVVSSGSCPDVSE